MDDITWGLYMTAAGMGTVFLLLALLMLALKLIGRLDGRSATGPTADRSDAASGEPAVTPTSAQGESGGLSPDLIAAITIAVITHASVRRSQAAPAMRRVAPGSQLFASRWVSVGRAYQNQPWK